MALRKTITKELPVLITDVLGIQGEEIELYIKIKRYSGECNICNFLLEYYNEVDGNLTPLNFPDKLYSFVTIEDGGENDFNVRKQAYEYLKTLPEFEGCEDC